MGRIGYCEVCGVVEQRRAAEIYDGIDNPPQACWQCEPALKFEQERIIKLLEAEADIMHGFAYAIALIKGEE
jgi:predicted metal-binding protein